MPKDAYFYHVSTLSKGFKCTENKLKKQIFIKYLPWGKDLCIIHFAVSRIQKPKAEKQKALIKMICSYSSVGRARPW